MGFKSRKTKHEYLMARPKTPPTWWPKCNDGWVFVDPSNGIGWSTEPFPMALPLWEAAEVFVEENDEDEELNFDMRIVDADEVPNK